MAEVYKYMFRMNPSMMNKQIFDRKFNLRSQRGYTKHKKKELRRLGITYNVKTETNSKKDSQI